MLIAPDLTPRQRQVLDLLPTDLSSQEIARRLRCRPETLRHHLINLYARLGARSRCGAIGAALACGLLVSGPSAPPVPYGALPGTPLGEPVVLTLYQPEDRATFGYAEEGVG